MARFPKIPKNPNCEQMKKIEQAIADYNFLNRLTPSQVRKGNNLIAKRRRLCYKPFNIADFQK